MKVIIPLAELSQPLPQVLRRAGFQLYRQTGNELVFSRRLSRTNFFPRFHLYLHQTPTAWEGNLHYDLRQTVEAHPVHGEEYGGQIVEEEYDRLMEIVKQKQVSFTSQPVPTKTGSRMWIGWLLLAIIGIIIWITLRS